MKTQQDALGVDQVWQDNFVEAVGREIVRTHVGHVWFVYKVKYDT